MKKLIIMAIALGIANQNFAQTEYARVSGFSSLEDAFPALFLPLPNHSGYQEVNFEDQFFIPFPQKYTDFGVVQKRVTFKFIYEGSDIVMYYQDHEMEDKTRDEWEPSAADLNKKDKKIFDEFVDALKNIQDDDKVKSEAYTHFFSNSMAMLGFMKVSPEKTYEIWNEKSIGVYGRFSYLTLLEATENLEEDFSDYEYSVDLELRQVGKKVPLKIVMYADLKSKSTNPEGMSKNIMALNKKENYWFTDLHAEIVAFDKLDDGSYLLVLKDFSKT